MESTSNNHSSESSGAISNGPMTNGHSHIINDEQNAALLPQLESFERMMKLPVVEAAWNQSQDVYGKVKGKSKFPPLNVYTDLQYCMWNLIARIDYTTVKVTELQHTQTHEN